MNLFFVTNLHSEITKIDILLREKVKETSEWNFLKYLKTLIEETDKKKVEFDSLESGFKSFFLSNQHN